MQQHYLASQSSLAEGSHFFKKWSKHGHCPEGGGGSTLAQIFLEHFLWIFIFGQNAKRGEVKPMPKDLRDDVGCLREGVGWPQEGVGPPQ